MDFEHNSSSSLRCEVRIIEAKNMIINPSRVAFVRCYLSAGNRARVRIESQEMASNSDSISWNQTFSLDCIGTSSSINFLEQETLVVELRWRSKSSAPLIIARIQGSKLIGRAEVSWKDVVVSANMEIQKWLLITPQNVANPIALQIALKIQEVDVIRKLRRRVSQESWHGGCACVDGGCKTCADYEFFAIEAALEAI